MKNILFTLVFFFLVYENKAQVVSAPVVESLLTNQTAKASNENSLILKELKLINKNLEETKEVQYEIRDIKKREEQDLLTVPSQIKNGPLMNSILNKEGQILSYIKSLINISNNPTFKRGDIENFVNPIMKLTSANVDDAIKLCTDNLYRMSPNERKKMLESINNDLSNLENKLSHKIFEYKNLLNAQDESIQNKNRFQDMKNKKIIINTKQNQL